jgi:hypothetical protein
VPQLVAPADPVDRRPHGNQRDHDHFVTFSIHYRSKFRYDAQHYPHLSADSREQRVFFIGSNSWD